MWLEHLVELNRRTSPPPALPEKQEAFVRGFSFYNDLRPPHYLVKHRSLGLPDYVALAAMLPIFTLLCLQAWMGRPIAEVSPYLKWVSVGFIVLIPLSWIYGYAWKGHRMRKRRWDLWEWPDFASFAMEEANGQVWGAIMFSSGFILLLAFIGWVAR